MKKIFSLLLLLAATCSQATTLSPITLLNPAGSTSGQAIVSTGPSSAPAWGTVSGASLTGIVPVVNGGTGWATLAPHYVLLGAGTSQVGGAAPGASGTILSSVGTSSDPVFQSAATLNLGVTTGTLAQFATGGAINPASVGATTAGTGSFTTLASSGNATLNGMISGGVTITGGSINSTTVGATTAASGKFTTLQATAAITPAYPAGIVGNATGSNVTAGSSGEFICAQVTNGGSPTGCATNSSTPTSIPTSNTATNVTSISLTAGDWDVCGQVVTVPAGTTTISGVSGWISTSSATLPTGSSQMLPWYFLSNTGMVTGQGTAMPLGCTRLLLGSTTTVYLSAYVGFGASTMAAYGWISGHRR